MVQVFMEEWAWERVCWSLTDWHKIIWSDESKFNLFGSDGRIYVRRRVGEEYLPQCVQQMVKFGGGSVMYGVAYHVMGQVLL